VCAAQWEAAGLLPASLYSRGCWLAAEARLPALSRLEYGEAAARFRFRVWDLGFEVWGLGFGVWGLGFGV
jgi:hypothetical protein